MDLLLSFQSQLRNTELKDNLLLSPRSSVTWSCQSMINLLWLREIMPSFGNLPSFLSERTLTFTGHSTACWEMRSGAFIIALCNSRKLEMFKIREN